MEVLKKKKKKVIIAFPILAKIDDNPLKSVKTGFKIGINVWNKFLSNVLCKFKQQILSLVSMIITSFKINATIFLKKLKYL